MDLFIGFLLGLGAAGLLFRLWLAYVRATKLIREWPWVEQETKDGPLRLTEKLTQEQRQALEALRKQVKRTQADVWDAFETTYMSDAKSAVSSLGNAISGNEILPPAVRTTLTALADEAWQAIVGIGSTEDRAQKSHAWLGALNRAIEEILEGEYTS